ncbi:hypothetical protein GGX14DRAFT_566665 [Mycena pura]|uniref:Uncharacterized protein n=1 Tax=Mycena pura TaxID=153505 RepID=A0AAD6VCD6_9AGAR|nr:hypothetical protein GGX14DRAFT_566665 [Mycena pura]
MIFNLAIIPLLFTLAGYAVGAPITKRCSISDINGVVTEDNSGGGECEASVSGVSVSSGTGNVANAGSSNGGHHADALKHAFDAPIIKRCSITDINGVVTEDNSGGGECEASVNGVSVSSGSGNVANAGTKNGGDPADASTGKHHDAFGAPITKRCSITDINGVVTEDNSGGGECETSVNGVSVSSGSGNVANGAGASNGHHGGDFADEFKNAFGN